MGDLVGTVRHRPDGTPILTFPRQGERNKIAVVKLSLRRAMLRRLFQHIPQHHRRHVKLIVRAAQQIIHGPDHFAETAASLPAISSLGRRQSRSARESGLPAPAAAAAFGPAQPTASRTSAIEAPLLMRTAGGNAQRRPLIAVQPLISALHSRTAAAVVRPPSSKLVRFERGRVHVDEKFAERQPPLAATAAETSPVA